MFSYIFLDHPRSVGESYGSHMKFAAGFGWQLARAAAAAFLHALIPCLCADTSGNIIREIHHRLEEERPGNANPPAQM